MASFGLCVPDGLLVDGSADGSAAPGQMAG
jgi:hypothetical protein